MVTIAHTTLPRSEPRGHARQAHSCRWAPATLCVCHARQTRQVHMAGPVVVGLKELGVDNLEGMGGDKIRDKRPLGLDIQMVWVLLYTFTLKYVIANFDFRVKLDRILHIGCLIGG